MSTTTKKTTKKATLKGVENTQKLSKKEIELRKLAKEVQEILAKHKVKPFNRKELYASN
ncbi:hypothetical protein [Capnocytophaga catalasegens]|uniref:Uncharacterized protein n=1 Tax=Capnocytophaga catalasegens TaxID=1004260 RepID=A0AAV5AVI2_9FLAO|nr:hypothetical protein [Capnocytophaga catalasegens]GIZ15062.1 hypothetical protein RCZ03_10620 [Capnocytophaga catalasegens]GJM49442.1 hypothetical protein RCZ15_04170 [Capnocytophaga catalasegens]GJM52592.1 hypothetical protein RCZ16_09090 [Capnocytophaga catalasegens]